MSLFGLVMMSKSGSIHIYYSAQVDRLVDALNNDIKLYYQTSQNPLKPLNIIVPNGHIQKYVNQRLTQMNGIAANMEFPFLETGLYQALNFAYGDNLPPLFSLQEIEIAIWGYLCDQNNQDNAVLLPLFEYLYSSQNPVSISQKRWQLAQQLALLFIDYELSRPEMINAWLSGHLFFKHSDKQRLKSIEAAQRSVYLALFKHSKQAATINGLLRDIDLQNPPQAQPLLLFVPSRLSPLHRHIILLLAQHYPVHIYHFNVCREFWQDLETDSEKTWRQSIQQLDLTVSDADGTAIKDPVGLQSDELKGEIFFDLDAGIETYENPLLKAWGKPGRETLHLLSDLENDAIYAGIRYQDNLLDEYSKNVDSPACTLRALQHSILNRIPGDDSLNDLKDTVQLAAAPSIEVEVSQVYNSILYELKQDPSLQLTDIAVLVTDMSTYRYVIEQVFDRLNRHVMSPLRYSISDSNAGEESLYARAVSQLLVILESDFIRDEVFTFLANPCVMTAIDSHLSEIDAWLKTAVDLGIFRGFNKLYESADESTRNLYTWQQGLQRLHRSLVQSDTDNSSLSSHEIGRLSVVMRQLNAHKTTLNQQQSSRHWQQTLQNLLDTFIAIPEDHQQEQAVALSVSQDLQLLADKQPDLILNYDDIKHYLLSRLTAMGAGRGRYLSGGVVCAALQPMRPVPFKLTYVLGLGESQFPGQIRHNTLDLAAYSRRIGDINQVENNKYLFLETVMSSQNKLFLSYVARDAKTGDVIAPSVVVNDVMDWFEQHSHNELPLITLPLSSADHFQLQTRLGQLSFVQNYNISDYLLYRYRMTSDSDWPKSDVSSLTAQQRAEINHFAAIYRTENPNSSLKPESASEPVIELNIADLSAYLINPTETIFAQQGGLLTRIEDTDLLSDEPLRINPLDKHQILNQAVAIDLNLTVDKADENNDLAAILNHQYQGYLQQSRVPIQLFASIDHLKNIQSYKQYQLLKSNIESNQLVPLPGNLVIGSAYSPQTVTQQLSAVSLDGLNDQTLELSASISQLLQNSQQQIAAQVIVRAGDYEKNKHYELLAKAFLQWCLMILHDDVPVAENHQVWLIYQDRILTQTFARDLLDKKMIKDYLLDVSSDFIGANNAYLPLSLHSALTFKFNTKDSHKPSKAYSFKSQFYFAYKNSPMYLLDSLRANYQQALDTADEANNTFYGNKKSPVYNEIKTILSYPATQDVLTDYRDRFMLFFALLEQVDIRNEL